MPAIRPVAEQDLTVTGAWRTNTGSCTPSSRSDRTSSILRMGASGHAVRFPARADGRIDDVQEPWLGLDVTVQLLAGPSPGPDDRLPDKQIHRWLDDGGTVLPHD